MYKKNTPYSINVTQGKETYICQCGKTANPPFCDGAHKQTDGIHPLILNPEKDANLYVCGCGKSANMPWCDGSHNK